MSHSHSEELLAKIADELGKDADEAIVGEVAEHLAGCENCRIQFDSVKQTVALYKSVADDEGTLPGDVAERLYKVLNLRPPKTN